MTALRPSSRGISLSARHRLRLSGGLAALLLAACSPNSGGPGILDTIFAPADPARFAYSVNLGDGTLSGFVVEPGTGRLVHQSYFAFATLELMPAAAAVHPSGEFLFVVGAGTDTISVLGVDPATGALSNLSTQIGLGGGPHDVVVHPTLDYVYVSSAQNQQITALRFDRQLGTLTPIDDAPRGTIATTPAQLLMDPRGAFLASIHYIEGVVQTWEIWPDDGGLFTETRTLSLTPAQIGQAVMDSIGGNIYVTIPNFDTVSRIRIERSDRYAPVLEEARQVEFDPTEVSTPVQLALHPAGNFLYVLNQGTDQIFYFAVDREDSTLTQIGFLGPIAGARTIQFEPVGGTAYLTDPDDFAVARYAWVEETGALEFREETRTRATPVELAFVQDAEEPDLRADELYVTCRGAGEVAAFAVDATTGALSQVGGPAPAGATPLDLALARPRPFAFAADAAGGALVRFEVRADGSLFPIDPPVPLTGIPAAVATDPSGRFVYAASSGSELVQAFAILAGGELAAVGDPLAVGDDPTAARVDPTGRFLYVANGGQQGGGPGGTISIFSIEPRNGALTLVIPGGSAPGGPLSLAFAPTATRLYAPVVQLAGVLPYDISTFLGTLDLIGGGTPAHTEPVDVAISPTGRYAYVALRNAGETGSVQLFDVRAADGALYNGTDETMTPRQSIPVGPDPIALAIDPREDFLWVVDATAGEVWRLGIQEGGTLMVLGVVPTCALPSDLELTTRVE